MTTKNDTEYQIIFCTCPSSEVAKKIATQLVESNLAACVNILPELTSVYRWENKTETQTEILLMIKSTANLYHQLEKAIIEQHPYDTPEIIALPIKQGLTKYLKWIDASVQA